MKALMICLFVILSIKADIPSLCDPVNEINGTWNFYVGPVVDRKFNCSSINIAELEILETVTLNISIEEDNSHLVYLNGSLAGRWSSMDVEGLDVFVNGLHYQAYFKFLEGHDDDENATCFVTNCSQTLGGWVRQDVVRPDEFRCFYGEKTNGSPFDAGNCTVYIHSKEEMIVGNHRSGRKYNKPYKVKPAKTSRLLKDSNYPAELDWSNYNGLNYVLPVYDQESCGSCYAFGTLGALEARILIQSLGAFDVSISQQDIVSCSHYSQGCDGGFGQEVGFWAKDHGLVDNKCFPYHHYYPRPYENADPACSVMCPVGDTSGGNPSSTNANGLIYVANVSYVGGYHGACTIEGMIAALQDGPIPVGIYASAPEFRNPKPGLIIDSNSTRGINHGVVLVGYGEGEDGLWWKIKNSWGPLWGDNGFARIRRGNNTLQIESDAEIIVPLPYTPPSPPNDNTKSEAEKKLFTTTIIFSVLFGVALITAIVFAVLFFRKGAGKSSSDASDSLLSKNEN